MTQYNFIIVYSVSCLFLSYFFSFMVGLVLTTKKKKKKLGILIFKKLYFKINLFILNNYNLQEIERIFVEEKTVLYKLFLK